MIPWPSQPPPLFVKVELVRFGEPETAIWCEHCLLPSAIRQEFRAVSGMAILGGFVVTICEDCGQHSAIKSGHRG